MLSAFKHGIALLAAIAIATPVTAVGDEVNVYSSRQEDLIRPLLERFSAETGIRVNLVTGRDDALLQRLRSEGRNSPADLLITADAGRLHRATEWDLFQPVRSELLEAVIPDHYRDPEGRWYGLTLRARPIMYVKGRVDPAELSTYEALADPKWRRRICTRSSNNVYNQSLVASMIASRGEAAAEAWAAGLVSNFARRPTGGDRDQIRAAAAGQCDIVIANTYYLGGMLRTGSPAEQAAAEKIGVFWPNQQDRGTHVNISGGGITRSSRNPEGALKLLEFLLNDESQAWYATVNSEYPVKRGIAVDAPLSDWGDFKADTVDMAALGENNAAALRLMDRVGWR